MSPLEPLARSSARVAAHDVLMHAVRMLNQAGHYEASWLLIKPENYREFIRSATDEVASSLPPDEPPSKLPKTWPFPTDCERALV